MHDVINRRNFGVDRFWSSHVAGRQTFDFPIDFRRQPYTTLTLILPCDGMVPIDCLSGFAYENLCFIAEMVLTYS